MREWAAFARGLGAPTPPRGILDNRDLLPTSWLRLGKWYVLLMV